jgi:hypothetical protein
MKEKSKAKPKVKKRVEEVKVEGVKSEERVVNVLQEQPGQQPIIEKQFLVEAKAVTKIHRKVCIVGCADSKKIVPWSDPEMEFWGVNNLYGVPIPGSHYDRWFEIHNIECVNEVYKRRESLDFRGQNVKEYLKGIAAMNCPIVYMQKKWDLVPQSVEYPLEVIIASFGRYFTNTVSYEIALAILMGYEEIHVFGVDMATGSEWSHQRPSCEFFLGWAAGRGIKLFIPDEADLLKVKFLYGFEEPKRTAWMNKVQMVRNTMAKKQVASLDQMKQGEAAYNQYIGAIHAIDEMNRIWD